jgi:putative oxidoreductase
MRGKGIPQLNIVMPVCIALKVIGGLLVLSGWYPHFGALLLLIVAIPSLVKLHSFWHLQGAEKALQKAIFVKEVAVIGGLLLLLAIGAGHFAV